MYPWAVLEAACCICRLMSRIAQGTRAPMWHRQADSGGYERPLK